MKNKLCTLVFLVGDGQILLAKKKRGFGQGLWNGAGGKLEPGETLDQAMVRECQEEIGVTPTHYQKVGEHDFKMDNDSTNPWHMYVHVYLADKWQGEPVESDEMSPKWFKIDKIPYDKMWQDDAFWLPQVLSKQMVYGQCEFNSQNVMTKHEIQVVPELPGVIPDKL